MRQNTFTDALAALADTDFSKPVSTPLTVKDQSSTFKVVATQLPMTRAAIALL